MKTSENQCLLQDSQKNRFLDTMKQHTFHLNLVSSVYVASFENESLDFGRKDVILSVSERQKHMCNNGKKESKMPAYDVLIKNSIIQEDSVLSSPVSQPRS